MTSTVLWVLVAIGANTSDARVLGEYYSRTGCQQVLTMTQPSTPDTLVCAPKGVL